jgi:hypothetical protein
MPVYFLDKNPIIAAQNLCDEHIFCPFDELQLLSQQKYDYIPQPLLEWTNKKYANHRWLLYYRVAKIVERAYRKFEMDYNYPSNYETGAASLFEEKITQITPFPRTMPKAYQWPEDCVEAWRLFYFNEFYGGVWTRRTPPQWFVRS